MKLSSGSRKLEWVRVSDMRVSPKAQRDHSSPGAMKLIEQIAAEFDPDRLGTITVSERDGVYWVVDGGHRRAALIKIGYEDQLVQCWCYHGLTEEQEADLFLDLNNVRVVSVMDKFKVAVIAGRGVENEIADVVRSQGLSVGGKGGSGNPHIRCVAALMKVYNAGGPKVLATTLAIIKEAYGAPGFSARVTEGIGLFVATYEGQFDQDRLVQKLAKKLGGVNGLLGRAEQIKSSHGVPVAQAVAASAVETYNQGRGGVKLIGWWASLEGREAVG